MTASNNPLEMGFGKFCRLDGEIDFLGLDALRRIAAEGPARVLRGLRIDAPGTLPDPGASWPVLLDGQEIGRVAEPVFSPRLGEVLAIVLVDRRAAEASEVAVCPPGGSPLAARLSGLPFS